MKHIKLITYMREKEFLNPGLQKVCDLLLGIDPELECLIFTEHPRNFQTDNKFSINNCILPGTKYVRLLKMINEEEEDCLYISIDNDIIVDEKQFVNYIKKCIELNVDFSWARLMAQQNKGVISKLVSVDKLLSHNIIRPLLWKSGFGVSIPGQCFVFRPQIFKRKLYEIDTFLDDLALGTYVSENSKELKVYISKEIIGYEFPNNTFMGLCRQRKRWAKGYFQVLQAAIGKPYFSKICIHGIVYHGNWILNWLLFLLFMKINILVGVIYMCLISTAIVNGKTKYFFWGILYQIVFPVFHMIWAYNLIKGEKNNDNE